MDYSVQFTPDTVFKQVYYRNFKNKNSKHVLCFPDHNINGHKVFVILLFILEFGILW